MDTLLLPSVMLLALGFSLRMALKLLYGARGAAPEDDVYLVLRILSWSLLLIPAGLLIVASTGFFSLILLVAIIEACFEFILAQRAAQRTAAWRLLVAAIASGRSTVEDLRFHQNRFSGFVARAYRKLLADLNGGMPWSAAIAANRRALPRMAQAVAGVFARDPAAAVRDFDEDDDRDAAFGALREHMAQRVAYLATISMMMVGVMTFVAIKVVPSYQAIFADFGLDLPKITISFIVAANAFSSYAGGPILAAIVLACAAAGIVGLFYLCDRPVLQNVGDRLARSRHDAQVLRLLAGAIVRGAPLDEALAQLSHGDSAYPSRYFRRRLIEAGTLMFTGAEWQAALHKARFVTTAEADALRSAQRVGNLPAVLRHIADRKVRVSAARWAVAFHVALTTIILFFGLIIMWYAVAMFVPLVDLINNLAQ
jgi:hypothetical protein